MSTPRTLDLELDVGTVTDQLAGFWHSNGQAAAIGAGTLAALVLLLAARGFTRSQHKDRWIDRIAAVLVLAWTSEGMWEVATGPLGFPVPFAVATFFVVEAMLVSSAMRATEHRTRTGVPGASGTLVWVLAGVFGAVVALAADTPVEFVLRIALPLAAVSLWWTGLVAERASDTEAMRAERARRAEARAATWAVTPRTLLVRWGLMQPGKSTTTEAQREHQIRRMVELADRATTTTGRGRARAVRRLRALTRTADEAMVAEVASRVRRSARAEHLMVPDTASLPTTPTAGQRPEVATDRTASAEPAGGVDPAPRQAVQASRERPRRPARPATSEGARRAGLPPGVTSTREITDDELASMASAWIAARDTAPTANALYEHYGLRADRAKRLLADLGLTPSEPITAEVRARLTGTAPLDAAAVPVGVNGHSPAAGSSVADGA